MEDLINHFVLRIVKENGFLYADKKAILLIKASLESHITSILKVLMSYTIHSKKQSANIYDFFTAIKNLKIKLLTNIQPIYYSEENVIPVIDFKSPISTYLERYIHIYIHIYDFMPSFPPTHTFRQTYLKNKEKEDKSQLVKSRLEQSLRSERNLLKLIKGSGSLPSFVNYLYKK